MTRICEFCFYSSGNSFIADKWVMEATVMETWRMVKHGCMDSGREILDRLRDVGSEISVKALTLIRAQ